MYWTVPDAKGDIGGWQHLDATDLPTGVAGSSAIVSGSQAFLIGGTTSDQPASPAAPGRTSPRSRRSSSSGCSG